MEICAFIDIFTTQNDLFGHNNCPIQFCSEIFTNDELYNDKFMQPERRKIFNIIPDEKIMMSGAIESGYTDESIKTSDFNGMTLKDGLERIYTILDKLYAKGVYLVGFNHISYDMAVLNANFKRVLEKEPIVFPEDHVIDLMKIAETEIPVTEIGNYTMDSVLGYITGEIDRCRNLRNNKSTATEIKIEKMMFSYFIKSGTSLKDVVSYYNQPKEVDVMNFGKYKGAKLTEVFNLDKQYLNWILKNKDMNVTKKDLIESIKKLYNSED